MNMDELQHISEAARDYNTTVASLLRMGTEGVAKVIKHHDDYFIVAADLRRVAELAKDNPRLMHCEDIGGPCRCL